MEEKELKTEKGIIHYFVNILDKEKTTLVFLPGLTADNRLFEKQIEYFEGKENVFVWDAPGHNLSRPFTLDFELEDKARWLKSILEKEGISKPVIVGQSMGGYVAQAFTQIFPELLKGFISIDSAPIQKIYNSNSTIWFLKHTEGIYRCYPWKALIRDGAKGCAVTEYGINLMAKMIRSYNHKEYAKLVSHGYKMLAHAIEKALPYEFKCPVMLICGKNDQAGMTKKYNEKWHKKSGYPIHWIENAGHNSNSDKAEEINKLIEEFLMGL